MHPWQRIVVFIPVLVALLSMSPKQASAFEVSGYFDGVAAVSRVTDDYLGGTAAPGIFPGTLRLSSGPSSCFVLPIIPPCVAGAETDFSIAAAEFKLNFTQDFEEIVTVLASVSLHSAASGGGLATSGASSDGQFDFLVQQAAARFSWKNWELLFGRFYAPIGLEGVDADSRPAATLSNTALALEPFFLTGAMVNWAPATSKWGGFAFVANDLRGGNDDANSSKALGIGVSRVWRAVTVTAQYHLDWSNSLTPDLQDATHLMALSLQHRGETFFGGAEVLRRQENAANVNSVSGTVSGTARIFAAMAILGWNLKPVSIGVRGEWIHVSDPDLILASSAQSGQAIGPSSVLLGDGDVYGGSVFVTWAITRGVFVRGEYRIDAADYDKASTPFLIINPDTAKAHLGLLQVNASFE